VQSFLLFLVSSAFYHHLRFIFTPSAFYLSGLGSFFFPRAHIDSRDLSAPKKYLKQICTPVLYLHSSLRFCSVFFISSLYIHIDSGDLSTKILKKKKKREAILDSILDTVWLTDCSVVLQYGVPVVLEPPALIRRYGKSPAGAALIPWFLPALTR